jgi:type II secretory pathway predicted ATPase ExeA
MTMHNPLIDIDNIYEQTKKRPPSRALGLLFNPFPPTGIAGTGEAAASFYPRQVYLTTLRDFVSAALRGGDFCGLVVIGEYGSGKTSLLRNFGRELSSAQARGIPVAAVHVANPGTSFADVLQAMTHSIGQEVLAKYAWAHLITWLKASPSNGRFAESGLPVPPQDQLSAVTDAHEFWGLFHDQLGVPRHTIATAVSRAMQQALPDPTFGEGLSTLMLGDRSLASHTWSQLTKPLPPYSSKKPVPTQRMDSLMTIFRSNGVEHLFLAIDELEDVVFSRMTKKLRDDFTATLRAIIGEHGADLSIVLASNLPGWQLLIRSDASLEDRFRFRIELTELTPEEIHDLIWHYVGLAQDPSSDAATRLFTEATIAVISKYRHRIARSILTTCHSLAEHFWDSDQVPSPDDIERLLTSA